MPGQTKSMEDVDKQVGSGSANGRLASQQQVKSVQEALKEKGYDPGAIDGAMGPRTSAALRDFQKAEGLQATGRVDAETRGKLGI
ncbi:MAG: peptidoglycan-binding domain-containing protein [Candidatus Rokuibacteriota bacterium]